MTALTAACGRGEPVVGPGVAEAAVPALPLIDTTATTGAPPPETTTTAAAPPPPTTAAARRSSGASTRAKPTLPRPPIARPPAARPVAGSIVAYHGLGTWVDVYDWSHYRGRTPTVGPDDVDVMAEAGVQTLYIQTAKHDTPEDILEPHLLLPIIERAHQRGIRVVAWYLPTLEDVGNDLRRLLASANLDVDGIAVDIEARDVADIAERNRRLVELSAALRQALPGRAIGAIVLPPVVLEVINQKYWPDFPYRQIAPYYDVWMTMGYWTFRTSSSGYRDAYRYTDENLRRLRNNLGQPLAPVHPIGGIGDRTSDADLDGFARAAEAHRALGGSIYDWHTTKPEAWGRLRVFRA